MYNENNVPGPEYRVRPVVRYVVTRFCHAYLHGGDVYVPGGSEVIAEVPSEERAFEIADAMKANEEKMASSSTQQAQQTA